MLDYLCLDVDLIGALGLYLYAETAARALFLKPCSAVKTSLFEKDVEEESIHYTRFWLGEEGTWQIVQDVIKEAFQERIQKGAGQQSEGRGG